MTTTTPKPKKTIAQIEAWIRDCKEIKAQETGGGDYRMWLEACRSLNQAERLLAEAKPQVAA